MAHIRIIPEEEAEGDVRLAYEKHKAPWGGVDNILKIHGLLPDTLVPHSELYRNLMFGKGPLSRKQREMLAVVVSKSNNCLYCVHHHGDSLFRLTKDKRFTDSVKLNWRQAGLESADEAMLDFAARLTTEPGEDFSGGVSKLKQAGFSESAILHITLIVAYFNFVNRIANGLGVELETYWQADGYSDPRLKMAHD